MTLERHKKALSYGEIPPSFARPIFTTSRLPDEHLSDAELLDKLLETDLRETFVRPGLVR